MNEKARTIVFNISALLLLAGADYIWHCRLQLLTLYSPVGAAV